MLATQGAVVSCRPVRYRSFRSSGGCCCRWARQLPFLDNPLGRPLDPSSPSFGGWPFGCRLLWSDPVEMDGSFGAGQNVALLVENRPKLVVFRSFGDVKPSSGTKSDRRSNLRKRRSDLLSCLLCCLLCCMLSQLLGSDLEPELLQRLESCDKPIVVVVVDKINFDSGIHVDEDVPGWVEAVKVESWHLVSHLLPIRSKDRCGCHPG
ncbi:MAG: hypothetical protein J3Q66DRAFT_343849 [Benniella sp.]|nr:MAG: hypothetical protein J3Q66DRAFT_343849 [Benniella sp.]